MPARTVSQAAAARRPSTRRFSRRAGRAPKGYANGIKARGEFVFVGGMVGWDANEKFPKGFVAQARQALENIVAVLAEGGARPEHIVRLTWYVLDMDEYLAAAASSARPIARCWAIISRRWRWCRSAGCSSRRRGWRSKRRRWCRSYDQSQR